MKEVLWIISRDITHRKSNIRIIPSDTIFKETTQQKCRLLMPTTANFWTSLASIGREMVIQNSKIV